MMRLVIENAEKYRMHFFDPVLQDRHALIDQTNGLTGCISKQYLMFLRVTKVSLKKASVTLIGNI